MSPYNRTPCWEVRRSGIHNSGLFATRAITQGERVLEYFGERITKEESHQRARAWMDKARQQNEGMVYIFELDEVWDLDGNVDNNPAKFANHHCEPNCEAINEEGHIWLIAAKDIRADDELTFDYGYAIDSFFEHPCRCGAPSCVGYIVRRDQRWRLRRMLAKKPVSLLKKHNKKPRTPLP